MHNCHFRICSKAQECHAQRFTNLNELHDMFFKEIETTTATTPIGEQRARKHQNFKILN